MLKRGDNVNQKDFPEINGVVLGFHRDDFSNDPPVLIKTDMDKILVIPESMLERRQYPNAQ